MCSRERQAGSPCTRDQAWGHPGAGLPGEQRQAAGSRTSSRHRGSSSSRRGMCVWGRWGVCVRKGTVGCPRVRRRIVDRRSRNATLVHTSIDWLCDHVASGERPSLPSLFYYVLCPIYSMGRDNMSKGREALHACMHERGGCVCVSLKEGHLPSLCLVSPTHNHHLAITITITHIHSYASHTHSYTLLHSHSGMHGHPHVCIRSRLSWATLLLGSQA